jgi:two-component system phosphate regulon sensor histidine kinase PhoR
VGPASPRAAGSPAASRPPLRVQLTVALVGVILVAMVPLAAIVPQVARAHQVATLEGRLTDEAQIVADYVATLQASRPPGTSALLAPDPAWDRLAKRLGERADTRITLIALTGTVVGESHQDLAQVGNHASRREVRDALATGHGVDEHVSETVGYAMLYVAVPIREGDRVIGVSRAALALADVDRLVDTLTQGILLAAAGAGLLALVVALLAAGTIARPLALLTRQAAALADDPTRPSPAPPDTAPPGAAGETAPARWPAAPVRTSAREVIQLAGALDRLTRAVQASLARVGAERDRLDAVLANLADGVVMIDGAGRIARLNPAATQLLGQAQSEAHGRTLAEVLRDHELVALVERARRAEALPRVNTAFLEWQRPPRFLRAAVTRFGPRDDRQTLLVLQDLTELRRLETVRRDFVANVSHELRTPIAAVKAMVETLQEGAIDDPEAGRDFLARIESEVDGLHQLVEELLELSRLESGRATVTLAPTDPALLVQQAVRRLAPLAERAHVALRAEAPDRLPLVDVDAERMAQVLVGVIHNAVKFTPPGGSVVVSARRDGGRVRLSVADTGVGLASEDVPRIFERFYKASPRAPERGSGGSGGPSGTGGTGLGLAIAKHTVQLHDGTIWAESDGPGRGTAIQISLPRSAAALAAEYPPAAATPAR